MSARSILVRVFAAFFIVPAWLILPGIAPVRGATLDASRAVTYGTAAGTWDSAEVGLLRINQSGASVSGSYATGVFSGSISGHTITFSMWEEATSYNSADPEDRGSGSMTINADWTTLSGSWKADQGNTSGTLNATRVAGAPNYTTGTDMGDDDMASNNPYASYYTYNIYDDQWLDANFKPIPDAYTFAAWMQQHGFEGSRTEGWDNQGVQITELSGLRMNFYADLGCTKCLDDKTRLDTPGNGHIYLSNFWLFHPNNTQEEIEYRPDEGVWIKKPNGTGWSVAPFQENFDRWLRHLPRPEVDAFPDMAKMFEVYCLTNGAIQDPGTNVWHSPYGYTFSNPFARPTNQDPGSSQLPLGQEGLPTNQDLVQEAQAAQEAFNALHPTDPVVQEAFDITTSPDGFEK